MQSPEQTLIKTKDPRARLIVWYVVLTVAALVSFGLNSFFIVKENAEQSEHSHMQRIARLDAYLLSTFDVNSKQFREIVDRLNALNADQEDKIIIVDELQQPINTMSAQSKEFFTHWKHLTGNHISHHEEMDREIPYHWSSANIGMSNLQLMYFMRGDNLSKSASTKLAARLAAIGALIFWIALWVIVVIASAISRRMAAQNAAIIHQAYHDPLTALPNRAHLQKKLAEVLEGRTKPSPQHVVLIVINIDRFKEINNTLGHQIGDRVLRLVADRLRQIVWPRDTVARLGGDVFSLLLPVADESDCHVVLKKMISAMDDPFISNDLTLELSVTAGVSIYPKDSSNAADLVGHAEVAMREAKRRNESYLFYDPNIDPHSLERLTMLSDLKRATERDELYMCYQPLLDISSGTVQRLEALARWNNATRGLVAPDKFIPLAEQTGMIRPLTYDIIRMVARQIVAWRDKGINFPVAINLSALLVHDRKIVDIVREAINDANIDPHLLEFEITESAIMLDPARALESLNRLTALGVELSVDDFGSGYTSLGFLKNTPASTIKIDRSFVMNMLTDANDQLVVRSIIDLAHNMSRKVVAEGVENVAILQELSRMACDYAQGYFFTKPLRPSELEQWLASYRPVAAYQ